ncbi:hypothetical protein V7S43_009542 [Phytophthora oleae]|uniref:SCP domain-containing protein n=1 Tax=Phytophthora oleae TaxID=2107226 RepID=A0ABD3FEX4_9STRA
MWRQPPFPSPHVRCRPGCPNTEFIIQFPTFDEQQNSIMITKSSSALLLLVAAASNEASEAANLRQVQRNLDATYVHSSDFLSEMLARVNKERAAEGLPPVCSNKKLQSSSQRHSDDMAQNNYMAHDGTDGSTMSQRITDTGYKWSAVGENVAAGQEDVQAVMDAWMHSPEHRENIMGEYTMLGVTYAFNENTEYKHYWTQDFGMGDTESCDSDSGNQNHNADTTEQDSQSPDQEQVAQNEDEVQDEADVTDAPEAPEAPESETPCPEEQQPGNVEGATDTEETPVPKTVVVVTKTPEVETPCPEKGQTDATVQETTPVPESQRSGYEAEAPGKVNAANDCYPNF